MPRVMLIPGLASRGAAVPAARTVHDRGHDVTLLRAPSWRGTPADLELYGVRLAAAIERGARPVDLLVGLSIGTQAAAVTAVRTDLVRRLLLISPTADPDHRTTRRLLLAGLTSKGPDDPGVGELLPEWAQAGPRRMLAGLRSAVRMPPLEELLPQVAGSVTVAYADYDGLTSRRWAERIAADAGGRFVRLEGASHSWPAGDPEGFAELVDDVLRAD